MCSGRHIRVLVLCQSATLETASVCCVLTCDRCFRFQDGVDASHSVCDFCGYLKKNVVSDLASRSFTVTTHGREG